MAQSAASTANSLPTLYSELNHLGENGEYERALKTANKSKPRLDYFIPDQILLRTESHSAPHSWHICYVTRICWGFVALSCDKYKTDFGAWYLWGVGQNIRSITRTHQTLLLFIRRCLTENAALPEMLSRFLLSGSPCLPRRLNSKRYPSQSSECLPARPLSIDLRPKLPTPHICFV